MNEDDWAMAVRMLAAGTKWATISKATGLSVDRIRRRLDPGYAERRNDGIRAARRRREGLIPRASVSTIRHATGVRLDPKEIAAALATVPPDTRDHTARLMGDPLPGRSALERRHPNPIRRNGPNPPPPDRAPPLRRHQKRRGD